MTNNEKFAELLKGTEVSEAIEFISPPNAAEEAKQPNSFYRGFGGNGQVYSNFAVPIVSGVYNGEKSPGSLGNPIDLRVDPRALRFRAYEANTTNDVITIITGKFFKWVIGNGLKMQAEPAEKVLVLEKVKEDFQAFKNNVEDYFELYGNSERSDYSGMDNLHLNAAKAFETAFLGGDCLVVLRVDEKNNVNCQVIDGQHVNNPISLDASEQQKITAAGQFLVNGIVVDKNGKHVAFYARKQNTDNSIINSYEYERIDAYGKESGCLMAWMVYGKKNRIDHHRGISMLSAILEKVTKLDRYTEATVATAEERAKLVWTIVHGKTSTGENPLIDGPRAKFGLSNGTDFAVQGQLAANQIALTEERKVYNLPPDSELKAVSSQSEINYEPFFKAIFVQLCAAVDIPPEVAMQQYNSNYSASRAAINGWGYIVDIYRKRLADKFYQPFYDLWLYVHIEKGKVSADKYIDAKLVGNADIVEAYSVAKFSGVNMPHIDPVKEIKALREALGEKFKNVPLLSVEQAAELGGYGDWYANAMKVKEEQGVIEELGLEDEVETNTNDAASSKD